jgi:hypothetical protein
MKKTRSKKSLDTVPLSCIFLQNDENKNFGRPSFSQIIILGTFRKVYSLKRFGFPLFDKLWLWFGTGKTYSSYGSSSGCGSATLIEGCI